MIGAWINDSSYGMYGHGTSINYAERTTLRSLGKADGLFDRPFRNYGRFAPITQRICCLTALALRDAGISHPDDALLDIGLLATGQHGCADENRAYFQDYVDGGRTLSRANLFIYTLPSSPIAEAAVHFRLAGPVLFLRASKGRELQLIETARRMIAERQAERMLVYELNEDGGRCLLVSPGNECIVHPNGWADSERKVD